MMNSTQEIERRTCGRDTPLIAPEEPENKINLDTFMSIKFVRNWFFAGFFAYISIFLALGKSQHFHDLVKLIGALFFVLMYFVTLMYRKWIGGSFRESIIRKKDLGVVLTYIKLVTLALGCFAGLAGIDFIRFIFSAFKG